MELFGSSASPFVRKVRVMAIEAGVDTTFVWRELSTTPVNPDLQLAEANPLAKMPTMMPATGQMLYDSRVICEYLDSVGRGPKMFPEKGELRWRALCQQALGDGILDAAVSIRYERNIRPPEKMWEGWIEGQLGKIRRGLDRVDAEAEYLNGVFDIGAITLGCVAGYLDFRFPEEDWRKGRVALASWYETFAMRNSMTSTTHAVSKP